MKGVLGLMIKRTIFNIKFCCKKYCRVGSKQISTKLRVKLLREVIKNKNIERTDLRIDYCDERLVYSNGDISVTKGDTYTNITSIKSPDFPLFNDIT